MSIFKCKMCGGTIEFEPGASVGVCDSCGTKQTLPRLDDDRRANLYDRANHFRRNNEFDKAAGIYEQILNEDTADAEAYWSLVLCRYGIEYVEDPATHKRVPTVNRAQFTSIFDDDNYRSALEHADAYQRMIYEDEANAINEIQKGILAISQKEEPFDVFICYKETDNNGRRTPDSVLANDLYHQLTQEGFKVFFARITLEDKLGTAYEPYIFAALNSAKVMVALGTRPEYFNAVWVKNEWSRYLALVKQSGGKKVLIPAYKDMDPYDLPDEFSHLQAQDMSKLGFMQDLIRGIKKIAKQDEPKAAVKETVVVQESGNANTKALVKRGNQALEDREWENAEVFFNRALDLDAECAEAFMGKFLAGQKVVKMEDLVSAGEPQLNMEYITCLEPDYVRINELTDKYEVKKYLEPGVIKNILYYDNFSYSSGLKSAKREQNATNLPFADKNYIRAIKYAGLDYKTKLMKLLADNDRYWKNVIKDCEEHDKAEEQRLKDEYEAFLVEKEKSLAEQHEMAEKKRRADYDKAVKAMQEAKIPGDYVIAAKKFSDIGDDTYLDCKKLRGECIELQKKLKNEIDEAERKRKTKSALIVASIIAFVVAAFLLVTLVIIPSSKYNAAVKLYEDGQYEKAITAFTALNGFKDSDKQITKCETAIKDGQYDSAVDLYNAGKYEEAITAFTALNGYKDSAEQITKCETAIKDGQYDSAVDLYNAGKYAAAITAFTALNGYKDCDEQITKCETAIKDGQYDSAVDLYNAGKYEEAITAFTNLNGYKDSDEQIAKCEATIKDPIYNSAINLYNAGKYERAVAEFTKLNGYRDSADKANEALYAWAESLYAAKNYRSAIEKFQSLGNYSDSAKKAAEIMESSEWLKSCIVNDVIIFGSYEQDNDKSNGAEKIEWIVLAKENKRILVISKYALDQQQFNTEYKRVLYWEDCSLRKWLNDTFLNEAFTSKERLKIPTVTVTGDDNPKYPYHTLKDTKDKIFILSATEATRYFSSDDSRVCNGTAYFYAQGNTNYMHLRTPGRYCDDIAMINMDDGSIDYFGYGVHSSCAVRPAMWIDIGS